MEECDAIINSFMDQGVLDDPESINTVNEAMADLIDHVAKTAEVIKNINQCLKRFTRLNLGSIPSSTSQTFKTSIDVLNEVK